MDIQLLREKLGSVVLVVYSSLAAISDLIVAQLDPLERTEWIPADSHISIWNDIKAHLPAAISMSPANTASSFDEMNYPFVRFWHRNSPHLLEQVVELAVLNGNEDWPTSEVVLIQIANKPSYDVVKVWRMIHLVPVLAKVTERMVLIELAKHIELEETQFGSKCRKGIHDTLAKIILGARCAQSFWRT